jgi:hypothetical protein
MNFSVEKYISEDGLARLDLDDTREPFPPFTKETVNNENGILFLSEFLLELDIAGEDIGVYKQRVLATIETLRVNGTQTFTRRPGQMDMINSHDNWIGLLLIYQLYDLKLHVKQLDQWGQHHFWSFNNLEPNKFDFRSWIQPRDQALVRLANGRFPGIISSLWLMGSILTKSKHKRMMRLRMESVKMSAPKSPITWFLKKWWINWGGYERFALEVTHYYQDPGNPYRRLVRYNLESGRSN